MARFNGHEITGINYSGKVISAVYRGALRVWEAVAKIWRGRDSWRGREIW